MKGCIRQIRDSEMDQPVLPDMANSLGKVGYDEARTGPLNADSRHETFPQPHLNHIDVALTSYSARKKIQHSPQPAFPIRPVLQALTIIGVSFRNIIMGFLDFVNDTGLTGTFL